MTMSTLEQAFRELAVDRALGPLVYCDADAYVFTDRNHPGFTYEIADYQCADAASALRWIAHMAQKTWVTTRHLEQFAHLTAERFGGRLP